jgi:hypothetical protein
MGSKVPKSQKDNTYNPNANYCLLLVGESRIVPAIHECMLKILETHGNSKASHRKRTLKSMSPWIPERPLEKQ